MPIPIPDFHPKPEPDPPAMVRTMTREDVLWNRPIFRAPPLEFHPQAFDATRFAQELPRVGLSSRQG
jgi:hypothetical protein